MSYRVLDRKNVVTLLGIFAIAANLLLFAGVAALMTTPQNAYAQTVMFRVWDGGGDGFRFYDPLNWDTDIAEGVFVETGEMTLPAGFTGSLDKSSIYLPADEQDEIKIETILLTLTTKEEVAEGDYALSPTLFSKDIAGTPFIVGSSFVVHVE